MYRPADPYDEQSIQEFFAAYPGLLDIAKRMSQVETWIMDTPEFREHLARFADQLQTELDGAGLLLAEDSLPLFIRVLAYIHTTQALYIMGLLGRLQPGLGGDLLLRCVDLDQPGGPLEAEARVTLARITRLAKLEAFERIFGPERRRLVLSAIQNIKGE